MLFGIDTYYKCPKCNNLLSKFSLALGSTFGLKQFSDGREIAPRLPEYPTISKCSKCKTIFWLDKEVENNKSNNSEKAEFLDVLDYLSVIKNKIYRSNDEEFYIRQRILWEFNDRVRNNKPLFNSLTEEAIWKENNYKLIELLNPNVFYDKILMIEIHRYFGDFQKCIEMMSTMDNPDSSWILKAFRKEINNKNKNVFLLSEEL